MSIAGSAATSTVGPSGHAHAVRPTTVHRQGDEGLSDPGLSGPLNGVPALRDHRCGSAASAAAQMSPTPRRGPVAINPMGRQKRGALLYRQTARADAMPKMVTTKTDPASSQAGNTHCRWPR